MKIIRNSIIPFKGFKAINLFGLVFVRKDSNFTPLNENHERIHIAQMQEMIYVFFYLWYLIEWILRLFMKGNAYNNISFEKEAYENQSDFTYVSNRKHFSWIKYL